MPEKPDRTRNQVIIEGAGRAVSDGLFAFLAQRDRNTRTQELKETADLRQEELAMVLQRLRQEDEQYAQGMKDQEGFLQGQMQNIAYRGDQLFQAGPQTDERQDRFARMAQVIQGVRDPSLRQALAQEFEGNELQAFTQAQAQRVLGQIQDDVSRGVLGEGDEASPIGQAVSEMEMALQSATSPEQVAQIEEGYAQVKQTMKEEARKRALLEWGAQEIQESAVLVKEDPEAAERVADIAIQWQHGDIKRGQDLKKALRYARAGLDEDDARAVDEYRTRKDAVNMWMEMQKAQGLLVERPPTEQELAPFMAILSGRKAMESAPAQEPVEAPQEPWKWEDRQTQQAIASNKAERQSRRPTPKDDPRMAQAGSIVREGLKSGAKPEEITGALQEAGIDPTALPMDFWEALGAERGRAPAGEGPKKKRKKQPKRKEYSFGGRE